jgi:multicomponent Na+:H+ antiporter subunit C
MEIMLAILTGMLVAAGAYLMMSGKTVPYLFGLTMISNAANILIFTAGRLTFGEPPLVKEGDKTVVGAANALPQALILTAIVIGFGVQAFALVLLRQAYQATGSEDIDAMSTTDDVDYEERR